LATCLSYPLLSDDEIWEISRRMLERDLVIDGMREELAVSRPIFLEVARSLREEHSSYRNKYCRSPGGVGIVNPLYLDHYAKLMYYFSRRLFLAGANPALLDQIFLSLKSRSGMDLYYEVEIPDFFYPMHCLGTVLGRAQYGRYFVVRQGCTVGNNHGKYPRFGEGVIMRAHSKVIGDCNIGDNVQIAAGTMVIDRDIPGNSIVFGASPNQVVKENRYDNVGLFFIK
jgi:serine O-acetyltransferase